MARVAQWAFDDVLIDNDAREVRRNGIPVPLSPKAFQLLGILVSARPKALSKQELQEHLWPDTFVVEKNLTNLISEIREKLVDDPALPRFIRTVPRFGYAFVHPPSAMPGGAGDAATTGTAAAGESRRHNLPNARTSFIGRERELADLMPRASRTPLLTLTGVGGCGKTRLALELGRRLVDTFDDGVWFVDLSGVSEAALIAQSVASALDLRQQPPASLLQLVSGFLRLRRALLILDNCEHLIADCARIADALLTGAPGLTILATSREPLAIDGEAVWPVPPLSLPSVDDQPLDAIEECESVRLFLARAAAVDPTFRITDANRSAAVDICRQLDGVPLAIELAAARLTVLSVEQIRERLADRFALLQRGSFTAPPRQRALEASVDWSYDLLAAPERLMFQRLAVFPGGATIDTVEEVCAGDGVARDQILPLLTHLVNKPLVTVDDDPSGDRRYRYLETIRHYAGRRLQESGDADRLGARHLAAHLDLARRAEPGLIGAEQPVWLRRLHAEQDNLRAALEWSLSRPERAADGLELATALVWFWIMRGAFSEGQHWLSRALSMNQAPGARVRARATTGLGDMLFFQGDLDGASGLFDEAWRRRAPPVISPLRHTPWACTRSHAWSGMTWRPVRGSLRKGSRRPARPRRWKPVARPRRFSPTRRWTRAMSIAPPAFRRNCLRSPTPAETNGHWPSSRSICRSSASYRDGPATPACSAPKPSRCRGSSPITAAWHGRSASWPARRRWPDVRCARRPCLA